jgi:hypothetical protein
MWVEVMWVEVGMWVELGGRVVELGRRLVTVAADLVGG